MEFDSDLAMHAQACMCKCTTAAYISLESLDPEICGLFSPA